MRSRAEINRRIAASDAFAIERLKHGHRFLRLANSLFPYQKRSLEGWAEALANRRWRDYDERGFLPAVAHHGNRKPALTPPAQQGPPPQIARWRFPLQRKLAGAVPRLAGAGRGAECGEDEVFSVFREALEAARRQGVRVIACTAPLRWDVYRTNFSAAAGDGGRFFAAADEIQALIDEYDIPYVNYRLYAPVSEDDSLFLDDIHLNDLGAEVLTDRIAHHLFLRDEAVPGDLQGTVSDAERQFIEQWKHPNMVR